jgi:hypothetical protein
MLIVVSCKQLKAGEVENLMKSTSPFVAMFVLLLITPVALNVQIRVELAGSFIPEAKLEYEQT